MLLPLIIVPVVPKPTVESTEITVASIWELLSVFVLPGIVNTPSIRSRSLYPTNKDNL